MATTEQDKQMLMDISRIESGTAPDAFHPEMSTEEFVLYVLDMVVLADRLTGEHAEGGI